MVEYLAESRKTFSRIGIGFGAFLLVSLVLQFPIGVMMGLLTKVGITVSADVLMIVNSLLMYAVGGGITYLIIKDLPLAEERERITSSPSFFITAFFICISLLYIGNMVSLILMGIVNGIQGKPTINPIGEVIDQMNTWGIFLSMVVMAPIFEELFFRKLLIDRVRQYGDKTAIIVSGFVFGLSHGNFYQFFYAFALGAVFSYIYLRTGKVIYTIIFHAIINFMGSIVALYILQYQWLSAVYGLFILVSIIAGVVLFIFHWKNLIFNQGEKPVASVVGSGFCNFGMVLFFLLSAAMFLMSEIIS